MQTLLRRFERLAIEEARKKGHIAELTVILGFAPQPQGLEFLNELVKMHDNKREIFVCKNGKVVRCNDFINQLLDVIRYKGFGCAVAKGRELLKNFPDYDRARQIARGSTTAPDAYMLRGA